MPLVNFYTYLFSTEDIERALKNAPRGARWIGVNCSSAKFRVEELKQVVKKPGSYPAGC